MFNPRSLRTLSFMAILVFEHSDRSGIQRLGTTLRGYGHRLKIIRIHRGDTLPPDLDDTDGIVVCGGPQSANDDSLGWLKTEMEFVRTAHEHEMPVIGLCLGSQIVARALGGTVDRNPDGPEIGWGDLSLTPTGREDPLYAGLPWKSVVAHWHQDCVSELPDGARLLASSPKSKNQVWAMGLRTYGIQYHPEIDRDGFEAFAADEPDAVGEAGLTPDSLREETEKHYPTFERLTDRLFESIALFLMPVDRRYRGLVKDLHH